LQSDREKREGWKQIIEASGGFLDLTVVTRAGILDWLEDRPDFPLVIAMMRIAHEAEKDGSLCLECGAATKNPAAIAVILPEIAKPELSAGFVFCDACLEGQGPSEVSAMIERKIERMTGARLTRIQHKAGHA
jgi:hypothetical protein